ncbi:MAG: hypothetical protein ABI231_02060 [Candidatus Tumulicola sp.]
MEIEPTGKSSDPGVLFEWRKMWGETQEMTAADAFTKARDYLSFQLSWSEEPQVIALLHNMSAFDLTNRPVSNIWYQWLAALTKAIENPNAQSRPPRVTISPEQPGTL